MKKITKIEATESKSKKKLRVAAYCRVSTDNDAQLESLDTQKTHYESYISARNEWELAGIYVDGGISGTSAEKRTELMKMMADCETGKIDFVITKSISRFSRNTTDCLEMVRKLLELNIPIFFEKENINTGAMESELFLSILSSMAQDESASNSLNNQWAIKTRFKNGTYKMGYPPYGYDWNGEKVVVNPTQAKIVKRIFHEALCGKGGYAIAKGLNADNIPTKRTGAWTASTINGILKNEKYTGDAIFQKTYTDSNFKRKTNHGERDQYMIPNHHEAIISKEDFETVSTLVQQRANQRGIVGGVGKYQKRYVFSSKIICGECNGIFKRRTHTSKNGDYIAWCCITHLENKDECSMLYIQDDDLQTAFITMMNKLIFSHKVILKPLLDNLKSVSTDANVLRIQELKTLLLKNTEQRETLTKLMVQGYIDQIMWGKENNELLMQAESFRREIDAAGKRSSEDNSKINNLKDLLNFVQKSEMLILFDDELFSLFVSRIIVYTRHEIGFELNCGLTFRERI
ncbi:recombinase family protein [Lachnospiraceae bacterium ZAX-1]